jgi:hypothetical protein
MHRHGKHSERIILPQILFRGEWKFSQIVELSKIAGREAGGGKFLAVLWNPGGACKRIPKALEL